MFASIATLIGMLMMVLFPVLIPAVITGAHAAIGWRRNRAVATAGAATG